jgi:hypothetical protein
MSPSRRRPTVAATSTTARCGRLVGSMETTPTSAGAKSSIWWHDGAGDTRMTAVGDREAQRPGRDQVVAQPVQAQCRLVADRGARTDGEQGGPDVLVPGRGYGRDRIDTGVTRPPGARRQTPLDQGVALAGGEDLRSGDDAALARRQPRQRHLKCAWHGLYGGKEL